MVMLGPHCEKIYDPQEQRLFAASRKFSCFQTMVGPSKSLILPLDLAAPWPQQPRSPLWFWHAAYIAAACPKEISAAQNSNYLAYLLQHGEKYGIEGIVLHTGATVGRDAGDVLSGIEEYFTDYYIFELLESGKVKLAIELGASESEFNTQPEIYTQWASAYKNLGWCLDLAHSYAAGVHLDMLSETIQYCPPVVCHCNFPGSAFGSGKDIHGWRSEPSQSKTGMRTKLATDTAISYYDNALRVLKGKHVPFIWEGSSLFGSDAETEFQFIWELLNRT